MLIDGRSLEAPAAPLYELLALVVHYLACFKAGLVVTPLNYRYTFREIDHALEVSGERARASAASSAAEIWAASSICG